MKLRWFLVLTLFTFSLTIRAQERCTTKLSEAPELRGLKLGMDIVNAGVLLPRKPYSYTNEIGERSDSFFNHELREKDSSKFEGIRFATIKYLDGKIISIEFTYEDTKWKDTDEFAEKISESLKLPHSWKGSVFKTLECDGFAVKVIAGLSTSRLEMFDLSAESIIERRRKEKEEKEKQTFKP